VGAPTLIPVRAVKYTPAILGFSQAPDTYGSITVIPVGYEHPSTTINGQSLTYFWRVISSGFSPLAPNSVTHSFTYGGTDAVGAEGSYVPVLYTRNNYTWLPGTAANPPINTSTNTFTDWTTPNNSADYLDADYTAGVLSSFGAATTFYSIASGAWNQNTTWSYTSGGSAVPAGAVAGVNYPGPNSIVIIENNRTVNLTANHSCASLQIASGSVLDIYTWTGSTFSMVQSNPSGNGLFRLTTTATTGNVPKLFSFPANSDFTDFNNNQGTTEYYDIDGTAGALYILPPTVTTYGNLILTAKGGDNIVLPNNALTTIKGNLTIGGDNAGAWIALSWNTSDAPYSSGLYNPTIEKTVYVTGNLNVNTGTLIYMPDYAPQHLKVDGNLTVGASGNIEVLQAAYGTPQGTAQANTLEIGGDLTNNSTGAGGGAYLRLLNGTYYCDLTFSGSNNATISGTSSTTIFNKVTVNKGSSQATTLTLSIGGTLSTPADNWLTLQNGTFRYMRTNPNADFTISTGTQFRIPATAGLYIDYANSGSRNILIANSTTDNNDLLLDGKLTVASGKVYVGPTGAPGNNNDIEYSGSGASAIEVSGGTLTVNGQIRRPVAASSGTLTYTQSGGDVVINGNNPNNTKAKLEVLNEGSQFNMTGGTITIVRGGGTTFGDLYLRPSSYSATGGTVLFSNVIPNSVQNYLVDANIPLYNLTVTGAAGAGINATLGLMVSPLQLNGSLTMTNPQSIFNGNGINVSLKGNLVNNGTINFGSSTTTFNGGIQTISGSSATNYYNLNVSSANTLTVNSNFAVTQNLVIGTGSLVLGNSLVTLSGNLTNSGSYTDNNTGSSGISFSGSSLQQISGTGAYGRIVINNAAGVTINNDITLQNNLALTQGILDINRYQLTLAVNSYITGSSFSSSKMIRTDGVTSSPGLRKFFTIAPQPFTFPVGVTGKYTPAIWDITATTKVGSIRVNPVNSAHPTVIDPDNALGYYWLIESSGMTLCSADVLLQYSSGDITGDESSYVAAKLIPPGTTWEKAPEGAGTDNVDETTNEVLFSYSLSNDLNGEYTAGSYNAIPGEIPTYQTNADGNWTDESIWTPVGASPPCPSGGPVGSNVIIDHVVSVTTNSISAKTTEINNELRIIAPTYGHNLGDVSGEGTIYVESGNLPAGSWDAFLNCEGEGTIEYGGTGSYTIIATLYTSVPNLFFTGTGTRILPAKDLTVCRRLVIDGPVLDNSVNNRKLTIGGTMERYNTGSFNSGTGLAPAATVVFAGTAAQTLGGPTGDFTGTGKFNNLEISNASGLSIGANGTIEVGNQLLLTNGIITTGSTNRLILLNTSSSAVSPTGGQAASYINGPLSKQMDNGGQFLFPIGKGSIKGHNFTLTSATAGTLAWTAEYFTQNPETDLTAPLAAVNRAEYWSVLTTTSASAKVKIGWDPLSDLTPLQTENGMADMRIGEVVAGSWNMHNSVTTGNNTIGEVETSNTVTVTTSAKNFTTASITPGVARASFTSTDPVCGTGGIAITFTSFTEITFDYTLGYTLNGVPQTPVTVTAIPYVLPAATPGEYQLTSFTYNNGASTGVVDQTTVDVYAVPQDADAGDDEPLCGESGTILNGNSPLPYAGLWTIVSGTGGTLVNNTLFNTVFTGVLGQSYVLRWTITNVSCSSSDEVTISFPVAATQPAAFTASVSPVCAGSSGNVYTVPFVAGSTYNWSYSGTGATITNNGNSASVAYSAAATSGTLSVTAANACGTSLARTIAVTVTDQNTWTGAAGSDWNTPGNWSCGIVPTQTTDIVINDAANDPALGSGTFELDNITIAAGASLTLQGTTLTVTGTITNNAGNDGLILKSDAGGDSKLIYSASNVPGTVELYLAGGLVSPGVGRFHYISTPMQTVTVGNTIEDVKTNLSLTNFAGDLLLYDETKAITNKEQGWQYFDGWNSTTAFSTMVPTRGYNIYLTGNDKVVFKGNINGSVADYGLSQTPTYSHQGWNLIGNPYPCNYDLSGITVLNTSDDVDNTVYYTKDGEFQYWNVFTNAGTSGYSDIVPPMQGFFVKVRSAGNSVDLPTAYKTASAGTPRAKGAGSPGAKKGFDMSKIKLVLRNSTKSDETIVCLIDDATTAFDSDYDAEKLFSSDKTQPYIHSVINNFRYAINSVKGPDAQPVVVPLTVTVKTQGTYSISIPEFENLDGMSVTLRHGLSDTKLHAGSVYSFTAGAGTYTDFRLIFGDLSTGIEPHPGDNGKLKIWYNNGYIYVNAPSSMQANSGRIAIIDMQGKIVMTNPSFVLVPGQTVQEAFEMSKGIYVVKISAGGKEITEKFVVF
jgi:hypothetical protein